MIRQISIFVANKSGRLAQVTKMLGENGVNILALSIADTVDYGILRLIVTDPDLAENVLAKSELTYNVTPVLGICVDHVPGGLSKALGILADAGHSVGYMYAFVGKAKDSAMVIIKAEDNDAAAKCLADAGIKLLTPADVENM